MLHTLSKTAVSARDLVKTYGEGTAAVRALDSVSVSFDAGAFTAIMGPSGSGKSTLLHCLAGLDTPASGSVLIGDCDLTALSDTQLTKLRRDRIGFVFQSFNLLPTLTARQNVLLPMQLAGRRHDPAWLEQLIDLVGLRDRLDHRPGQLSGGQQQRVACARALLPRPQVVFADEPTGNLDSKAGSDVLGFLRRSAHEFGQSIVMVTHDPVAAGYADRVVFLADGSLQGELLDPTPAAVLDALKSFGG